jgi:tetratricopeptide (TPR) repeat protein
VNFPLPEIGRALRGIRKKRDIKIKELTDSSLSKATISRIEHGKPVKEKAMDLLMSKLGIEKTDLKRLLDEMDKEEIRIKLTLEAAEAKLELGLNLGDTMGKLEAIDSLNPYAQGAEYVKARIYLAKSKWDKAKEHFYKAIKSSTKHEKYLYLNIQTASYIGLSYISYKEHNLEDAIELTEKGIKCFIPDGEKQYCYCTLHSNKATYLEKLGRHDKVNEVVQQILTVINELECKPSARAQFYQLEGNMLKHQKQLLKATKVLYFEYAKIHKLPSSSATLWTTLGDVFCEMEEIEGAEDCYLNAIELNNSEKDTNRSIINMRIYNKLTHLYAEQELWHKAYLFNKKALDLKEFHSREYIDTLINLSRLLFHEYDYKKAIQALEDAKFLSNKLKLPPDSTRFIQSVMEDLKRRKEK